MRALVIAVLLCAAASAQAAPWSFELPAGYTEQPGPADSQAKALRERKWTVAADVQVYLAPDGNVQLTRLLWDTKFETPPSRASIQQIELGIINGSSKQATKHVSDSQRWVGDQLVAETVDEVGDTVMHQRRLYAADSAGVIHSFTVTCAGAADQLGDCEKAQQTMQLTLPNQAALGEASTKPEERNLAYELGRIVGVLLVLALVIWLVRKYS